MSTLPDQSRAAWRLAHDGGGAASRTSPVPLPWRAPSGDRCRRERMPLVTAELLKHRSVHVGSAGEVGASPVALQYRLECPRQGGQVAVVDPPVVKLADELAEQSGPVAPGRYEWDLDLDAPLDDLHRGQPRGRGSGLLPGAVPTGSRAPLRDRPSASRSDWSTAPPAGRRRGPPFGTVAVRWSWGRASARGRPLGLLTPLPLALTTACSIFGATAGSHVVKAPDQSPETRHHELSDPRCMRCVLLDLGASPGGAVRRRRCLQAPRARCSSLR